MNKLIYLLIVGISLSSCSALKFNKSTSDTGGRIKVSIDSNDNHLDLKGIINVTKDSSYYSIFGPLGIVVAKIFVEFDSIKIVNIHEKTVIFSEYRNLSEKLWNIFNSNFGLEEKQLVCSLCYLIIPDKSFRYNCKNILNVNFINYKYTKGVKSNTIRINLLDQETNYEVEIKVFPKHDIIFGSYSADSYYLFEKISINF